MPAPIDRRRLLTDSSLRGSLLAFLRRRAPAHEVEDLLQTVLAEALSAPTSPDKEPEFSRWVMGIARHKVVDYYRKSRRELLSDEIDPVQSGRMDDAAEIARWVETEVPPANRGTLSWMVREAEGEKLESIAREENVPAPRVRQQVSRLRRKLKERWLSHFGVAAALAAFAILVGSWLLRRTDPEPVVGKGIDAGAVITPEPSGSHPDRDMERAQALRRQALQDCDRARYQECLRGLDEARALHPAGDTAPEIVRARDEAGKGLLPAPSSSADGSARPIPSSSAAPAPRQQASDGGAPSPRKMPSGPYTVPTSAPTFDPTRIAP